MPKSKKLKSSSFSKAKLLVVALLVAIAGGIYVFASQAATPTNFYFDVRKDNESVRKVQQGTTVNVVLTSKVDRQLRDIKVKVNGAVQTGTVTTSSGIGNTRLYRFDLCCNGEDKKIKVFATKVNNGEEIEIKSVDGDDAIEVKVRANAPVSNNPNGGGGNGGGSGGGNNGGGGNGGGSGGGNASAPVTEKPTLSITPGPLEGLAGSQTGTVNGDTVTGGVVFVVKFKRPKSEVYDLKTMHVVLTKDGQPRITIFKNVDSNLEVKEEGESKVYTFKRYYSTGNKPNGASNWQAIFVPSVSVPAADTHSNLLAVNINNPDSSADATCRELKKQVNDLFDTMTTRIDKNQQEVDQINRRIDRTYQDKNLATTNPIQDYEGKKAHNVALSEAVDSSQTELEALKLQCASTSPEDATAKVSEFKVKLEEVKGLMSEYRAATLDLLQELRARIPRNDDSDGDNDQVVIPNGFVKYNNTCFSFGARRGFTTENSSVSSNVCNKHVKFEKQTNGGTLVGRIAPNPFVIREGTLAENVEDRKTSERALGREISDERSFQLDGHNAVRFISKHGNADKILNILVEASYQDNGQTINGYHIIVPGYGNRDESGNGNYVKDSADVALRTWRWKGDGGGGNDGGGQQGNVPQGFEKVSTKCYTYDLPDNHKLASVESDAQGQTLNCIQTQQIKNSQASLIFNISDVRDGRDDSTPQTYLNTFLNRYGLVNNPDFELRQEAITLGDQPAIKLSLVNRPRNLKAVYVFSKSPRFLYSTDSAGTRRRIAMLGAQLYYEAGSPGSTQDRLGKKVMDQAIASWQWKQAANVGTFDPYGENTPSDELSKVACLGSGNDGPRVETIYLRNEGQPNAGIDESFFGGTVSNRLFVKRGAARINREIIQSAQRQNGFKQMRFANNSNCEPTVKEVVLERADQSPDFFRVYSKLSTKYGLNNPNKKYLVFWTDTNLSDRICGVGGPIFQPGRVPTNEQYRLLQGDPNPNTNLYNNNSGLGVFRLPCWGPSRAPGTVAPGDVQLHEFMHALGAVLHNAPHHSAASHCTDLNDVMCYQDASNVTMKLGVCPKSYDQNLLDCKGDDYFKLRPARGSFLDTHWNTANSKWLTSQRGTNQ